MASAQDERPTRPLRRVAVAAASLTAALALALALPAPLAQAQQPATAVADSQRLNAALTRLGRDPRNLEALIEAGVAALSLGDVEAAIGFLRRADQVSPGNPRVKAGLAGAMVRSENPFEAIRLFAEAQRSGPIDIALAADWGLAYDLVGDNAMAQQYYKAAVDAGANEEARRRMALSQAIAGDKRGFESTLAPLLQRQDKAAWRIRAFGLAILNEPEEAVTIANTTMPRESAGAIAPYLRYMPRLTRAQQAAAATFGHFPRASEIGRDDPRIAAYTRGTPPRSARTADAGLVPSGEPLGRSTRSREEAARQTATSRSRSRSRMASGGAAAPEAPVAVAQPRLAPPDPQPQRVAAPAPARVAAAPSPAPVVAAAAPGTPSPAAVVVSVAPSPAPVVVQRLETAPPPAQPAGEPQGAVAGPPAPPASSLSSTPPRSLASAFADLDLPLSDAAPAPGAVDIRKIQPARPAPAAKPAEAKPTTKPVAKPTPPAHPSRIWVQVATGRDKSALAFDWRRMTREAAEAFKSRKPFVSDWGQTTRLLTGPFESEKAANAFMAELRKEKMEPFLWTSPAGQVVDALPPR